MSGELILAASLRVALRQRDQRAAEASRLTNALRKIIACDERDHANPAAYAKAMQAQVTNARAALAKVQAPEQARAA